MVSWVEGRWGGIIIGHCNVIITGDTWYLLLCVHMVHYQLLHVPFYVPFMCCPPMAPLFHLNMYPHNVIFDTTVSWLHCAAVCNRVTASQEYYANTGALRKAAQGARGAAVGCSIVEAFEQEAKPRELEAVLRVEYRSKLLNPKYATVLFACASTCIP